MQHRTPSNALVLAIAAMVGGMGGSALAQGDRGATAGDHSLRSRIEMPLVYVAVEPRDAEDSNPLVEQLLGHPALRRLVGDEAAGPALSVFRRLLSRSGGAMEFALTDIRAGGHLELVFRGVLAQADADTLGSALRGGRERDGAAAVSIGEHPVYSLNTAAKRAGGRIEAVLAGRELIVSNDRSALESLFAEGTRSVSSLEADPVYRRLSAQLTEEDSEVSAFVDWARLQRMLSRREHAMLSWSGLEKAAAIMAALRSFDGGVATVAVVDRLGSEDPKAGDPQRGDPQATAAAGSGSAAGWFDLLKPMPPRILARSFPRGGVFSVLLAADPERLAASGVGGGEFDVLRRALTDGCGGLGLSFDNQVLKRLAGTGALQMMMVPGERGLEPVWSLRARSRSAASGLFEDLRRAVVQAELGEWLRERGQPERLRLFGGGPMQGGARRGRHPAVFGRIPLMVSTAAESLLFARTQKALDAAQAASRKRGSDLLSTWTDAGFDRNAKDVVGMLLLDVSSLLAADELEGFPTLHIGAIRVDHDYVRVEVVSPH